MFTNCDFDIHITGLVIMDGFMGWEVQVILAESFRVSSVVAHHFERFCIILLFLHGKSIDLDTQILVLARSIKILIFFHGFPRSW